MKLKEPIYVINANTNSCTAFTRVTKIEGTVFELPYKIEYKKEVCHNLETCDSCKNVHQQIFTQLSKVFQNFPLCCDYHANLVKANWFNKKEFNGFPKWTADKVMSAYHHFICKIDVADWQRDIPDYIEYILDSLGSMPEGFGEPLGYRKVIDYLIDLIKKSEKRIEIDDFEIKREFILKYLQSKLVVVKAEKFDVQSLIDIYSKWYKNFPFELELFSELKEKYAKEIPLLSGEIYYNPYLKVVKAKMVTQEQLIEFLFGLTKSILQNINTEEMLEVEYVNSQSQYNIDLIKKKHALTQNTLLNEYSKGEKRYIKTIKKWLVNESKFIKTIMPELQQMRTKKIISNIPNSFFLISATNSDEPIKDFFDTLSKNNFVEASSKSNFVKAFVGKIVKQKIVWSGAFGDLKSLIEYLIEFKKIKPTSHNHWQITANIFTRLNGGDFTSKEINATKNTKNDETIKKIVSNIPS